MWKTIDYCSHMSTVSSRIIHKFRYVLVRCRKARGLTQEQLSERAGISLSFLSMMEIGQRHPNVDMVFKLAKGLGMAPRDLIAELEKEVKATSYE